MRGGIASATLTFVSTPALVLLLHTLWSAASLSAEGSRDERLVAVAPLDGGGVDAALVARLDAAIRDQVDALGVPLISHDVVREAHALAPCEAQRACLMRLGATLGARRVLAGRVRMGGGALWATMKVVDVASGTEGRPIEEQVPLDQAARRLRAVAVKLLDPQRYNESGAVVVALALPGADVVIDGSPRGSTPLFGPIDRLPPGRREVEVRYAGLKSWHGFIDVPFDRAQRLDLSTKDGAIVITEKEQGPPVQAAEVERGFSAWTWLGVGVVGLGAAAGVASGVAWAVGETAYARAHDEQRLDLVEDAAAAWNVQALLMPVAIGGLAGGLALSLGSIALE